MSAADDRLTAILARAEAAWAEMDRLTAAPGGPGAAWRWSIPARPERDSDLILGASAADVGPLVAALRAVLDLHVEHDVEHDPAYEMSGYSCAGDGDDFPCRTVRAIESALGGGAA